jgi:hypothetical protein
MPEPSQSSSSSSAEGDAVAAEGYQQPTPPKSPASPAPPADSAGTVPGAAKKPAPAPDTSEEDAESAADVVAFPQRKEVAMALLIMTMGAFGGWFVGAVPLNGLSTDNLSWWQRLLVGAVAGGVMVYYVAKTDRRRFWHCLFFAFLCGMIGQPLIVSTLKSLLPAGDVSVAGTTAALQESSNAVAIAVGQKSTEETKATLQQVEDSAQKVIGAAAATKDPDAKTKATEALTSTMDKLGDSLSRAPQQARADMVNTLKNLAVKTYRNLDQKTALKAFEAIRPLADRNTETPEVQAVAESAKTQLAVMLGITPEVVIEAEPGLNPEALGKLKQALEGAGYKVPSVATATAVKGSEAKLIYYTSGDEADAQNVVKTLLDAKLRGVSAVLSTATSPAQPRHYELQVSREALANLQASPAAGQQ